MPAPMYDDDLAEKILERLAEGETLVAICRDDGMPAARTVRGWCKTHKEFGERYADAMEAGCHALLDETLEIADDADADYLPGKDGPVFNAENVQRAKLRIWTRHELAARKRPDLFSAKVKMEHTGAGGGPVEMVTRIEVIGVEPQQE